MGYLHEIQDSIIFTISYERSGIRYIFCVEKDGVFKRCIQMKDNNTWIWIVEMFGEKTLLLFPSDFDVKIGVNTKRWTRFPEEYSIITLPKFRCMRHMTLKSIIRLYVYTYGKVVDLPFINMNDDNDKDDDQDDHEKKMNNQII